MVLISTISSRVNRFVAPSLLRSSLAIRHALSPNKPLIVDNPYMDSFFLMPLAQTLISIEVQQVAKERQRENEITKHEEKNIALDDFVDKVWGQYLDKLSPPTIIDEALALEENEDHPERLKAFIEYMRPVLAPNEKFHDVNRWRFHNRFIKWLRSEYLICKYSAEISKTLGKYPKLKYCALLDVRSKLRDTMRYGITSDVFITDDSSVTQHAKSLPSLNLVNDAFKMQSWNKRKSATKEYDHMKDLSTYVLGGTVHAIPGTNMQIPDIDEEKDVRSLKFEELLEVAGCLVKNSNAFNALCDDADIYEFWTDDYVTELSKYLMERCQELNARYGEKEIIVVDGMSCSFSEASMALSFDVFIVFSHQIFLYSFVFLNSVGAGDGILAQFLREKMTSNKRMVSRKKHKGGQNTKGLPRRTKTTTLAPIVVATDDGSWRIKPKANVEKMSIRETLQKYQPYTNEDDNQTNKEKKHHLIVLCSWMPMGEDWTQAFRDAYVDEYILIGESDDGNCGHNWLTFGNRSFMESDVEKGSSTSAPYEADGYKRNELEQLTKLQFSRFDSVVSSASKTISFRKTK